MSKTKFLPDPKLINELNSLEKWEIEYLTRNWEPFWFNFINLLCDMTHKQKMHFAVFLQDLEMKENEEDQRELMITLACLNRRSLKIMNSMYPKTF